MNGAQLGTLRRVDLRKVWPHEATHFSAWLGANLAALNEALELDLELIRPEAPVGRFSLDLLAKVIGTEEIAVIENQLERTNHDHLGKLLTYTAGYDATHVIWITPEFCEEHRAALDWLNNNTAPNRNFFGIQVEALQIDDSLPAVSFKVLVKPNSWQKAASQTAREIVISPDQEQLGAVFQAIRDKVAATGRFVRLLKPLPGLSYYVLERTHSQVEYAVAFGREIVRAEVSLNYPNAEVNVRLFDALKRRAADIERAVGGGIDWDFKEGRRRQVLRLPKPIDRDHLSEHVDEIAGWAAEKMVAYRNVVEPGLDAEVKSAFDGAEAAADDEVVT